jgi:hypothetical protein
MDVDKLIRLVEERRHLYDPSMKEYSKRDVRENAWNAIGEELGFSGKFSLLCYFLFTIIYCTKWA